MSKIIFFDTETTGNTEKDYLCQIAYKSVDEQFVGLYKPPFKIPPEASAVHHISNKMLDGKPSFQESPDSKKIKNLFEDANSVVVAHNALFDLMIIKKEDITNVVIGDSKDFSGVDNKIMLGIKKFVEILEEKTKIGVLYRDTDRMNGTK